MAVLYATGVVVFSLILSVIYKYLAQSKLQKTNMATVTTSHAFTIEALQLSLSIKGLILCWIMLSPTPVDHYGFEAPSAGPHISTWLAATVTIAIHILAVFAIDLIENFIQLGTSQHPVQVQTLLLTRSMLFPFTIRRTTPARLTPETAPIEKSRGRSRTRKFLVSSTPPIQGVDSDPTTSTKLYELEGSLPDKVHDASKQGGSVPSTPERFMHKSRPLSTPGLKRYLVVAPQTPPASVSRARISTRRSLERSSDPDSPAQFRKTTPLSPEDLHTGALYRSASAPALHEKPAKKESGQPEFARTPIAQTTPPTTPTAAPAPITPESMRSNSNKPSPPFTCSTVSSALEVRPKVRTASAHSAKRDVVEMSSGSSGKVGGSAGSVREAVRLFEERS